MKHQDLTIATMSVIYAMTCAAMAGTCEDFQDVPLGDIPDSWCSGGGNSDFGVEGDGPGGNVLELFGSINGCWGGIVSSQINSDGTYQDDFTIEFDVRNGSEELDGCHPFRASLEMKSGCAWQTNTHRLFQVESDGTLSSEFQSIGWAPLDTWYTVTIRYTRLDPGSVRIQYWLNGVFLASIIESAEPYENDLTHLMWGAQEGTVWFDNIDSSASGEYQDFEEILEGEIPANWCDGGGNSNFGVVSFGPLEKALRLYGSLGGCWGAIASHPITPKSIYRDDFVVQFQVRNGSEQLDGCHPFRASLDMKSGCTWQTNSRRLFQVESNGTLSTESQSIGWAPLNTWYTVTIRYTRLDPGSVRIQYWLDGAFLASIIETAQPHETDLTHLMWGAQEGTVWFDDICMSEPACPADTNGDGEVDVLDVLGLIDAWHCEDCYAMDVTGDGIVDVSDILAVLGAWGGC